MKKRNLKSLSLSKESISTLDQQEISGGRRSFNPPCASFSCRVSQCLTYCDSMCQ
ncbi:hypothetical protein [uncultured Kordia sp.]|uniref:hypothetical protein n=1 Tax=uncultured Kordia sp. TaxID=507699 RepID=UPI002631A946|nr:hypothetical protein [uncultured Kordia sp.]